MYTGSSVGDWGRLLLLSASLFPQDCLLGVIILSSSPSIPAPASVIKIFIYLIWKSCSRRSQMTPDRRGRNRGGERRRKGVRGGGGMEVRESGSKGWHEILIWSEPMWHPKVCIITKQGLVSNVGPGSFIDLCRNHCQDIQVSWSGGHKFPIGLNVFFIDSGKLMNEKRVCMIELIL